MTVRGSAEEEEIHGVAYPERGGKREGGRAAVAARVRPGPAEPRRGGVARLGHADQADHRSSHRWPQRTKTGFWAARRWFLPGSGARREAWSWTPSAR